ncbi:MAG: CotH kinase family protein, partial [Armatimonadetes bacterium]|nr:CotH kinase family protein [Armatimonadota bacterium]
GGGSSVYPEKSLRLYADGYSDAGEFVYKIFPSLWITSFTRIILRNSGNDWLASLMRDGMTQGLMEGTEVDCQAYRPSILFINGEFWGIHNIRERYDKYYIESHHGEEDVDLIESTGEVNEGDDIAWNALQTYVFEHDLRDADAYSYIEQHVDLQNFIDYNLIEIFCRNTDWPAVNSRYWRPRTPDGKWRWMLYDTDSGFGMSGGDTAYKHESLAFASAQTSPYYYYPNGDKFTRLLRKLLRNTTFRARFVNRMADFLNSRFSTDSVIAQIDAKASAIQPHIQEHLSRWGRTDTLQSWLTRIEVLRTFARERPDIMRRQFVKFFGFGGTAEVTVNTAGGGSGTVRVNSLSVTPGETPWNGVYFQDIPIELEATPSPGSHFAGWEGINAGGATAQVTLTGDLSVTARFEVNP